MNNEDIKQRVEALEKRAFGSVGALESNVIELRGKLKQALDCNAELAKRVASDKIQIQKLNEQIKACEIPMLVRSLVQDKASEIRLQLLGIKLEVEDIGLGDDRDFSLLSPALVRHANWLRDNQSLLEAQLAVYEEYLQ